MYTGLAYIATVQYFSRIRMQFESRVCGGFVDIDLYAGWGFGGAKTEIEVERGCGGSCLGDGGVGWGIGVGMVE